MTTIQNNLVLAKHHLREITHDLNKLKQGNDLFSIVPSIHELGNGTYLYIKGKRTYIPVHERPRIFDKIDRTRRYYELLNTKEDLENWIRRMESEIARLSCENFPRVAI
jgi:hypothetical protein